MKKLSKEDFYKLAIVSFVFLIIVVITLVIVNKRNEKPYDPIDNFENEFSIVSNYNIFFFVNNNINTFIEYTADNNLEGILNYLEEDYKKENNINISNLKSFVKFYSQGDYYMAKLTKSYQVSDEITAYYTEGQILNEGFEETAIVDNNVKFVLYVDFGNMSASVKIVKNTLNENDVKSINTEKRIPSNQANAIRQVELIDTKRICNIYLNDFIIKVYNGEGFAYTNNFENREDFETYVENNNLISDIKTCNTSINNENKRVYTIVDTNNYRYVFIEESILNYKVAVTK